MLSRFRIEVEGCDSAEQVVEALNKYEHVLQVMEAQRLGVGRKGNARGEEAANLTEGESVYEANTRQMAAPWGVPVVERGFYNGELGREITDEVIEKDKDKPGYKGRRVVQLTHDDRTGGLNG